MAVDSFLVGVSKKLAILLNWLITSTIRLMRAAQVSDEVAVESAFTHWLVRWRWVFWCLIALQIVLAFNGQWRMGLDSAIYRGVAENLVAGNGYKLGSLPEKQIYPGLAYLLAGAQVLTGTNNPVYPLILMNLMALLSLVMVYQLIKLRYPIWVAVVVTCGVGINSKFVQQAHEIMTDTPFLFGVVMSMLGWEILGLKDLRKSQRIGALTLFLTGLSIAAVMRPTFWVVALAGGLTCIWQIIRYRERRSMIAVIGGAMIVIGFVLLDPRGGVLKGGYERQLLYVFHHFDHSRAWDLISKEFTESFFNEQLYVFGSFVTIIMLIGVGLLMRRHMLWGLQVFILCAIMMMMSDVPRYFLMVMPTLWLAWVLLLAKGARRLPANWGAVVMFCGISLGNFINIASNLDLISKQHSSDFATIYKKGDYVSLPELAKVIRDHVKPDEIVIGPYSSLLTYLSDRTVIGSRVMGISSTNPRLFPKLAAQVNAKYFIARSPHKGTNVDPRNAYSTDPVIRNMMKQGVIRPQKIIYQDQYYFLATVQIVVPPDDVDWMKSRIIPPIDPNAPKVIPRKHRPARIQATRPSATTKRTRPATIDTVPTTQLSPEQLLEIKRQKRLRMATTRATTQPKDISTPVPTTLPQSSLPLKMHLFTCLSASICLFSIGWGCLSIVPARRQGLSVRKHRRHLSN